MNTLSKLFEKLKRSKKYRESFVAAHVKTGLPFQIHALRKQRGWSQPELAKEANISQASVSRAEDPEYGDFSINTLLSIAAGFDVAFIARFVPYSELGKWVSNLDEKSLVVPKFDDDPGFMERKGPRSEAGWTPVSAETTPHGNFRHKPEVENLHGYRQAAAIISIPKAKPLSQEATFGRAS